ncbi:MAG TPA: 3-mercaptopyruvate sulfurtransferase [Gemmatimonadales bacterium]|nr:3-mercaptopyruvate sulfurtransferase [Gemmatimonadales bacterium]
MPHTSALPPVVSTDWLADRLGQPSLKVVDGSWYLPTSGRDAAAEFAAGHIPGAVFFDVDASSDRQSPLPHMLPPAAEFAARMSALGLDDDATIVVYDGSGVNLSAPRVWWTFRVFGHPRVAVLDGGSARWRAEGRPLERGVPHPAPGRFTARLDPTRVRDLASIHANLTAHREQVVDLRPADRFEGRAPEFRAGVRSGHIPGSRNLPFTELVTPQGTVLDPPAIRAKLAAAGVDLTRPVVASCGSGTSACALVLALALLGHDDVAVYDGSWTEWGGRDDTPVELGPARNGPAG